MKKLKLNEINFSEMKENMIKKNKQEQLFGGRKQTHHCGDDCLAGNWDDCINNTANHN